MDEYYKGLTRKYVSVFLVIILLIGCMPVSFAANYQQVTVRHIVPARYTYSGVAINLCDPVTVNADIDDPNWFNNNGHQPKYTDRYSPENRILDKEALTYTIEYKPALLQYHVRLIRLYNRGNGNIEQVIAREWDVTNNWYGQGVSFTAPSTLEPTERFPEVYSFSYLDYSHQLTQTSPTYS